MRGLIKALLSLLAALLGKAPATGNPVTEQDQPLSATPYPVTDEDLDVAARTIWGEARGESWDGKIAVAWVIRNRAEKGGWWGSTVKDVCLKKYQFSCWLEGDPNRPKMVALPKTDQRYRGCRRAMQEVCDGLRADPTNGACHYHATAMGWPKAWGEKQEPTVVIGNHAFYAGIR